MPSASRARRVVTVSPAILCLALVTTTTAAEALDTFLTYKIKDSRGSVCSAEAPLNVGAPCRLETDCGGTEDESALCVPKGFAKGLRVSLADRFETGTFDVQKPVNLGTPASPNGQAAGDLETHLKAYQITLTKTEPRQSPHTKRTRLLLRNVFHPTGSEIALDTQKPDRLLVPTARSLSGPVPPPSPATHAVDHYKCYAVKPTPKTAKFVVIPGVSIDGPFATPARRYDLKKPSRLCVPVEVGAVPGGFAEPIENPNASLLCYQAALAKTVPAQPKHEPVVGIFLGNRFGRERVDTTREDELCVPSLLLPAIGCTLDATRACYDGPPGTEGVGLCRAGTQTCSAGGTFGPCTGQVLPAPEIPRNGIDEDCTGSDEPGGDPIPPSTVTVDEMIRVDVTEIDGFDGAPARPVTALTDHSGIPMHFVENELIVVTDDAAAAAALAARWGGTIVRSLVPADAGLPVPAQHLVRVAPSVADVPQLIADLRALEPAARNDLRVAGDAGMRLLAAAAREAAAGGTVALNVVLAPHGFEDRTTIENMPLSLCPAGACPGGLPPVPPVQPTNDNCVCPGIPVPGMPVETFGSNAFAWSYMQTGGPQNIGVGEAWRALSLADLLGNEVSLAVIDGGFSNLAVDNPTETAYLNTVNPTEPNVYPSNGVPCSNGVACPWHGANVVSAAMGPADDAKGSAGPAGPIARALTIRRNADAFSTGLAYVAAFASPARIVNTSFGQRVPATLSWSMEPLNLLTIAAHAGGKVLIASAGNDAADVDSEDCLPPLDSPCWEDAWWSPCENDGVFCVGGLASNATTRASFSNWGNEDVDLFGPGIVWVGGDPFDPEPHAAPGTSFSAPFVAGVAALVMAANPQLTNDAVEQILVQTALTGGEPNVRRYVSALGAVNQALGGSPVCAPPQIFTGTPDHYTAPCLENVFTITHSQAFGPFRYQWKKEVAATGELVDVPEGGRVSGSTTDRMTIDPFWPADEGRYKVVVSNLCGSTTGGSIAVTLVDGRLDRVSSLPVERKLHAMAFDRGRNRMVLYGGLSPVSYPIGTLYEYSNETWERDGSAAWQPITTQGPGRRVQSAMAYDEARGVSVLFGGYLCGQSEFCPLGNPGGGAVHYTDTWEWDGSIWTQRPAAFVPPFARFHSMTYDSARQRVVMYGGQSEAGIIGSTVFEWDGTNWAERGTAPDPAHGYPPPLLPSPIAFDRTRNVLVLYRHYDTWELDGAGRWSRRAAHPNGIALAGPATMAADSDRGRVLLHGIWYPTPTSVASDLFEWNGSTWKMQPFVLPLSEELAVAYDSGRRRTLLAGGGVGSLVSRDAFEWRYFTEDPTCSLGSP